MEFLFCTLFCNNERPVKSLKVNFKSWHLVKSLRILKEFDEKSWNHEFSKYCKKYWHAKIDIGENAHYPWKTRVLCIFYCMNLNLSLCRREKYLIVFYEKCLSGGVNCVGKVCKNPIHFVCIFIVRRFFWPKILEINRALLKLFMHMKTHFSSISTYRDLSLCDFFLATLMYIYIYTHKSRCRGGDQA